MVDVHLCCNDKHGNFAGELFQAEFFEDDLMLKLEWGVLDEGLAFAWRGDWLRFGENARRRFSSMNRRSCVGNVFWDSTQMHRAEALEFARYLIGAGFTVTEHVCEDPWQSLDAEDLAEGGR